MRTVRCIVFDMQYFVHCFLHIEMSGLVESFSFILRDYSTTKGDPWHCYEKLNVARTNI